MTTLLNAIEELPETDRLILALYPYEELTFIEIAEVLNLSFNQVIQEHSKIISQLKSGVSQCQSPKTIKQ